MRLRRHSCGWRGTNHTMHVPVTPPGPNSSQRHAGHRRCVRRSLRFLADRQIGWHQDRDWIPFGQP